MWCAGRGRRLDTGIGGLENTETMHFTSDQLDHSMGKGLAGVSVWKDRGPRRNFSRLVSLLSSSERSRSPRSAIGLA